TGRRLAAPQPGRRQGRGPPQLDEAGGAGREPVDAVVGDGLEADALEDLVGDDAGRARAIVRPASPHLRRDEDVLAGGQAAEGLEALERAADAEPRPLMRLAARGVAAGGLSV